MNCQVFPLPLSECFTICSLGDDLNDKALASFEVKGTRVSTKLHSLLAYSHPIHMLILQVTAGRRTYCMKRFAVRFIPTIISKVYPDAFVGRNRANMEEHLLLCLSPSSPPGQAGFRGCLTAKNKPGG